MIVEPTGVAKLGNIINNIRQIEYERIILLKPITVIDGNSFDSFISSYDNIYIDQLINASKIIISKMESKDKEENEELIKKIENLLIKNNVSLNSVEILKEHYNKKNKDWWENILKSFLDEKYSIKVKSEKSEEMPDSISMKGCELENENQFIILLEDIIRGRFGDIARAKGFIKCSKSFLRFDVAGERYAITGAKETDELEIVFIGKNLNRKLLREIFQPVYRENIKHSHKH